MRKNKLLLLLALLLTAATGAWADETLLLTIESRDYKTFKSGSKTFDDKVTVTFSNSVRNDGDNWGWYANSSESLLTVAGINGYTITSCKFYVEVDGIAMTGYTIKGESPSVYLSNLKVYTDNSQSVKIGANGVTKIEVYEAAAPAGYTVSLKDGVKDAGKWTVKVGEGDAQALPFGGLKGDGSETVTLQYNGRMKVKGVKATSDAAPAEPSVPDGAINGKFSVSDGKQVYFSKGNLQAVCTSADNNPSNQETFTWQFAENQWDCVGNNAANYSIDGNGSVSAAGTVDLFGWSTAATTYGIHNSTTASDYSGDFVDWGGIIGTGWRTLTKDEWNYLFMTRESGSKVNGMSPSPDNARYTHATINTDNGTGGIRGMILFPDGVTVNYSDATSWGGINQYSNWNGSTKCTTSQWNALAAKGFVFLPTGGVRNGTTISNSNNNGYYWSSYTASPTSGYAHYTRVVASTEPTTAYDSRKIGISVRLVREVATSDAAPAEEPVTQATPLTIEAITAGTIQVNINGTLDKGMKYSVNGGTKTNITSTTTIEGLKAGDKVQFYSNGTGNTAYSDDPEVNISGGTAEVKVYGNIMSLLDEEGFATKTDLENHAFLGLFMKNSKLIDASELLLPAETVPVSCCQQMFQFCTRLTKAPKLPATTLYSFCYYNMFQFCTSLTTAPELPAKWLEAGCYAQMFNGCTSLTSAYVKAAYIDETNECYKMFDGCTATGATLHTTSGNKASWEGVMGTGKTWPNWTVTGDWQE